MSAALLPPALFRRSCNRNTRTRLREVSVVNRYAIERASASNASTPATHPAARLPPTPREHPAQPPRKPEHHPLTAPRHAVAAGERELRPPAEGEAVNRRHGRTRQRGKAIEHLLTAANELVAAR